jgi:hypothetical protein
VLFCRPLLLLPHATLKTRKFYRDAVFLFVVSHHHSVFRVTSRDDVTVRVTLRDGVTTTRVDVTMIRDAVTILRDVF